MFTTERSISAGKVRLKVVQESLSSLDGSMESTCHSRGTRLTTIRRLGGIGHIQTIVVLLVSADFRI